ncbi:virulence-associated V antigen [Aeromonas salmonicida]|uniref:virulence-associated V antigen n=1 Tax=Aeromonas salmonicida TaxID=645 RepID=UPI00233126C3|nr:virulence-associated V antigen [Aeromonas salmonicida]WCH23617.1 virulence-associated V antigen [Aeromonas salmonicida]
MSIISDYTRNQNQINSWLDAAPSPLQGKQQQLVELLASKGISISKDDFTRLTLPQLEQLVSRHFTTDSALDKMLATFKQPDSPTTLTSLAALAALNDDLWPVIETPLNDRLISIFKEVMGVQDDKRKGLTDEIRKLTTELKIYSVIQSEINKVLSSTPENSKDKLVFSPVTLNLEDYRHYGYDSHEAFTKGPEYDLLKDMSKDSWGGSKYVSARTFLESDKKQSGAMKNVEVFYAYDKDNNKLGNFATSVSDRSRPLNDLVSEKTTRLNDVSSRYNSAIEALNRFVQKYDSIMRDILGAI